MNKRDFSKRQDDQIKINQDLINLCISNKIALTILKCELAEISGWSEGVLKIHCIHV